MLALGLAGCGASSTPPPSSGPPQTVPRSAAALAERLEETELALGRKIAAWRRGDAESKWSRGPAAWARYEQRLIMALAGDPALAAAVSRRLPPPIDARVSDLTAALRELDRLGAGQATEKLRLREPLPLARLLGFYRLAERRFGVDWHVLAAVNMVETAFGRVRNQSGAGARGPMQFEPATWRSYGLGGDIEDPRDAVLGAANYLSASATPGDYRGALLAYNPSPLYVSAVLHLAHAIARERALVYDLYLWRP